MGLIATARYHDSNNTDNSSHSSQASNLPMIPLWVALVSMFIFTACVVSLLLYLYRYRREQHRLKLHHGTGSASLLLKPIKVSTQCQRLQLDRRLSKLSSQAMNVSSLPGVRTVIVNQMDEAGITYSGDIFSADSSPLSSPEMVNSKLASTLGLIQPPSPLSSGKSISQICTPTNGRLPGVPPQLDLTGRKGSLCRSQSLDSLSTDRSHVRTPSRQGSENDLTHLAVPSTTSRPTSCPGSTALPASSQYPFSTEGNFIRFTVQYNSHNMRLLVNVIKCYCNVLGKTKENKLSDMPSLFATVCLLPDSRVKYQTKVHYQVLHPQFNEQFTFSDVTLASLSKRHILVAVYNYEGKTQTLLGCCDVPLQQVSVTGKPTIFYEQLQLTKIASLVSIIAICMDQTLGCLSVCVSVFLSVCLSVCLSFCLSVCLCVCLSVCLSACQSVSLSHHYFLFRRLVLRSCHEQEVGTF
jgi:hypothetical protein